MKYALIAAALGWVETPELQEGLHLQPEEADKIEQTFASHATALQTEADAHATALSAVTGDLATANTRVTALEGEAQTSTANLSTATGQLTTAQTELAAANTSLIAANAEIARLKALSGNPATTVAGTDPVHTNTIDNKKYLTSYDTMFN
jgi:chromosome segregation ATPase